ncbi:MAG: hypothetical protein ACLVJH_17805 [Faecalibacterium prausnitzii]
MRIITTPAARYSRDPSRYKFTPILVGQAGRIRLRDDLSTKPATMTRAGITARRLLEARPQAARRDLYHRRHAGVDPDDRTPLAIKNTGAEIITYGAPVLPEVPCSCVSYLDGVPVCGLPGCVMYAKRNHF